MPRIASDPRPFKPAIPLLVITITALGAGFVFYDSRIAQNGVHVNPNEFTPCATVTSREPFSSTSSILTLTTNFNRKVLFDRLWSTGIWSVEVKQPDIQIARSYTPLPPLDPAAASSNTAARTSALAVKELRFLLRRYSEGEMSNYLSRLPVTAPVQLRGGHMEYVLPDEVARVVFIAAGTGISPAVQVAHALSVRGNSAEQLGRDDGKRSGSGIRTNMTILWASRKRDDVFGSVSELGQEGAILDQLKVISARRGTNGVDVNTRCFIDDQRQVVTQKDISNALNGTASTSAAAKWGWFSWGSEAKAEQATSNPANESAGKRLVIVSGPDGFVEYIAGKRQKVDGQAEIGPPSGGLLSKLDLSGWEVIKL